MADHVFTLRTEDRFGTSVEIAVSDEDANKYPDVKIMRDELIEHHRNATIAVFGILGHEMPARVVRYRLETK